MHGKGGTPKEEWKTTVNNGHVNNYEHLENIESCPPSEKCQGGGEKVPEAVGHGGGENTMLPG